MKCQAKTKLELIFSQFNLQSLSEPFIKTSIRGPRGFSPTPIIRALIAMKIEGIPTRKALRDRLETDLQFRYACGFKLDEGIPSQATLCRYEKKLSQNNSLENFFNQLVQNLQDMGMIDGTNIAIDATNLNSYEKPRPKKQLDSNNPKSPNWGVKLDQQRNKKAWFGWKLHLATDGVSELPVSFAISGANCSDSSYALPVIKKYYENCKDNNFKKPEFYIMDAAYDAVETYREVREDFNAQAIIPINQRKATEPPPGYSDFNGTPSCSGGYPMVYWGHDNKCNKFRCPHILGKVNCIYGSAWCSNSNYGAVMKTRPFKDPRYVSLPHRGSKRWKEIYNLRGSVERCFSRLKENLSLDNIRAHGYEGAKTHVLLSMIGLIGAKMAVETLNRIEAVA